MARSHRVEIHPLFAGEGLDGRVFLQVGRAHVLDVVIEGEDGLAGGADAGTPSPFHFFITADVLSWSGRAAPDGNEVPSRTARSAGVSER